MTEFVQLTRLLATVYGDSLTVRYVIVEGLNAKTQKVLALARGPVQALVHLASDSALMKVRLPIAKQRQSLTFAIGRLPPKEKTKMVSYSNHAWMNTNFPSFSQYLLLAAHETVNYLCQGCEHDACKRDVIDPGRNSNGDWLDSDVFGRAWEDSHQDDEWRDAVCQCGVWFDT